MASAFTPSISAQDIGIQAPQDLWTGNTGNDLLTGFQGGGSFLAPSGSSSGGWFDGWSNKDKIGLGALGLQGALGIGSYFQQDAINKVALDQAKYNRIRQEQEDKDYDAFKASWSGAGGFNQAGPTNAAASAFKPGPRTGTQLAAPVAPRY